MSLTAVGTKMFPTGQQRIDGTVLGSCCMSDKSGRNPNTLLQDNNSLKQGITGNQPPHASSGFCHGEIEPRHM